MNHTDQHDTLVLGAPSLHQVSEDISHITERKTPRWWYIAITLSGSMMLVLIGMIGWLFYKGIGIWGNNTPVGWAFDITNFVFWVGIGHAGTLISAVLYLLRQRWRTSINRFAEAMTLFAVICAGIWPTIHTGRPWYDYWLLPYPNQMGMWPQFRSPLNWDVFAVGTYFTVSLLFWYTGLIPDLATLRDRAKGRIRQIVLGIFALGWRGSQKQWKHWELAYLILAGIATPLVLSVHSVVSTDFATSIIPGWHSTIFPPYFVAGAIFSGFAMVLTLIIPARKIFGMEKYITLNHFDKMAKVILLTGMMVSFAYLIEIFIAWYSGNPYERFTFLNRAAGPYTWGFWIMITCNVVVPQTLWFRKLRRSIPYLFVISLLVNVGMWFERFNIIVTSLHRDFLPSSWGMFRPTIFDLGMLAGSFGLFLTLFLIFLRFLPMISISEVKKLAFEEQEHERNAHPRATPEIGRSS
jgi:molybdopterin-containing oxidoreductase family membrane subunit